MGPSSVQANRCNFMMERIVSMSNQTVPSSTTAQPKLQSLEDDDEFEEFEGAFHPDGATIDPADWQDEWDEENPDDAFLNHLRGIVEAEKQKASG
ncbi:putative 26 proteasome complex subunit DSS1 [Blattamonas nauphoetae]|uniref:26 proteasome complex subunit DSS1 n=1 Tax=Blattamonas nauphoetae TaxID=2049346 RepID=A0ABQ9YM00_9EUKA|nr:putative 26 proteasome complex subunit DSS1 [Blattamonas nauphoetae]